MRSVKFVLGVTVGVSLVLTACEDPSPVGSLPPDEPITTVDALLARACELAADCVEATQEDIDACPAGLLEELDSDDIAELEQFTMLEKSEQDRILDCFDSEICGRFGGSLTSISDSDLMEPLRSCQEPQDPDRAIAVRLEEPTVSADLDMDGLLGSWIPPEVSRIEKTNDPPVLLMEGTTLSHLIDFETPALTTSRMVLNPYVDPATGVVFSVDSGSFGDAVVGLVRNSSTSACVDPPSNDQKLGTGRGQSLGLSGFPIKATFPTPLTPPVTISYEAQMGAGARARIRLFDTSGHLVKTTIATVEPPAGTCGYPGSPRARKIVTAAADRQVAYAIMDAPFDPVVFVIDDFTFEFTPPVVIDIKPESELNTVNPGSNGVIPVAILGSSTLDITQVDQATLAFGPSGAPIAHKRAHLVDVDADGDMDLLAHFRTGEAGVLPGDSEACLRGMLVDGSSFEACDDLTTVPLARVSPTEPGRQGNQRQTTVNAQP